MNNIDDWWPLLDEQIRHVLVNGIWQPVSEFARSEIERLGGPEAESDYWEIRGGERYLPQMAVQWIVATPDSSKFREAPKPDPRAPYFRRGWPYRQP